MEETIILLKKSIIEHLARQEDRVSPYLVHKNRAYTIDDLILALETNQEIGNILIKDLCKLSIDLFERNKEKLNEIEKV
jgi:hypothetical protein